MVRGVRVFVIHRERMVRDGLRLMFEGFLDIEFVGESMSVERALLEVATLAPDVILMDIYMPNLRTQELTPELTISISRDYEGRPLVDVINTKEQHPLAKIAVVGRHAESRVHELKVSIRGHRIAKSKQKELANAIALAAGNDPAFSITSAPATQSGADPSLQPRDEESNDTRDLKAGSLPTLQIANGANPRPSDIGLRNGTGNGLHTNGNGHTGNKSNGLHANGNGHAGNKSNGLHTNGNGHAGNNGNGAGNGGYASEPLRFGRVAKGLFGPVRDEPVAEASSKAVQAAPLVEYRQPRLAEGTTAQSDAVGDWEKPKEERKPEELQGQDGPWLHMWKEPMGEVGLKDQPTIELDLRLGSGIGARTIHDFVLRLRQATKAEIVHMVGSEEGTSIRAQFHQSVPLMDILNAMPEVAQAKLDGSEANGHRGGTSLPQLPGKVSVVLKAHEEPKQLSLTF